MEDTKWLDMLTQAGMRMEKACQQMDTASIAGGDSSHCVAKKIRSTKLIVYEGWILSIFIGITTNAMVVEANLLFLDKKLVW